MMNTKLITSKMSTWRTTLVTVKKFDSVHSSQLLITRTPKATFYLSKLNYSLIFIIDFIIKNSHLFFTNLNHT